MLFHLLYFLFFTMFGPVKQTSSVGFSIIIVTFSDNTMLTLSFYMALFLVKSPATLTMILYTYHGFVLLCTFDI